MSSITHERKLFFNCIADFWKEYGLPGLCGYIDALLWLERNKDWTQASISNRLKELFGKESPFPSSVSSVNRAINVNVQYGTVIRDGSHKLGYTYHAATDSDMMTAIFQKFLQLNNHFINKLSQIRTKDLLREDPLLEEAINFQIKGLEMYSQFLEYGLSLTIQEIEKLEE